MAIKLVQPESNFSGPDEELYRKVSTLIYDKIDGLTPIGVSGVLMYLIHQVMHDAINAESDED